EERGGVPVGAETEQDQVEPWRAAEQGAQLALVALGLARGIADLAAQAVHLAGGQAGEEPALDGHAVVAVGVLGGDAALVAEPGVPVLEVGPGAAPRELGVRAARRRAAGEREVEAAAG